MAKSEPQKRSFTTMTGKRMFGGQLGQKLQQI